MSAQPQDKKIEARQTRSPVGQDKGVALRKTASRNGWSIA
jgi:hypothetical protein